MKRAMVTLRIPSRDFECDLDIPVDITAHDLITAVNEGYDLGWNTDNVAGCFLKTEHPIALLHGKRLLSEYGVANGTVLNAVEGGER